MSELTLEQMLSVACTTPEEQEAIERWITLFQEEKQRRPETVVLAHRYMRPELRDPRVADYVGDSLELSRRARDTDAKRILFLGVEFMGETAKILAPEKEVIVPTKEAGCSLAESIRGEDVRNLRAQFPDAAVVTYINTFADVKAESDITVTSSCAEDIVRRLPHKTVLFLPDKYMGANLQNAIPEKRIITYDGRCIVHELIPREDIEKHTARFPGMQVLAHPECSPDVVELADFVGGTSAIMKYAAKSDARAFYVASECEMATEMQRQLPDRTVIGPCIACPYMKAVDKDNALAALRGKTGLIIEVPEAIRAAAYIPIDRMDRMAKGTSWKEVA